MASAKYTITFDMYVQRVLALRIGGRIVTPVLVSTRKYEGTVNGVSISDQRIFIYCRMQGGSQGTYTLKLVVDGKDLEFHPNGISKPGDVRIRSRYKIKEK